MLAANEKSEGLQPDGCAAVKRRLTSACAYVPRKVSIELQDSLVHNRSVSPPGSLHERQAQLHLKAN